MGKTLKQGKVVVVLQGRHAGKKAVVVKSFDTGTKDKKFSHALVAGVDKPPLKVTKDMGKRKIEKRLRIKPFLKYMNVNHFVLTRYTVDVDLKTMLHEGNLKQKEKGKRKEESKKVKKAFEERYKTGKNKWFFQKLRF